MLEFGYLNPFRPLEDIPDVVKPSRPLPRHPMEQDVLEEFNSTPDDGVIEKVLKGWEDDK